MKRYLVQPGEIISLKEMDPNDISAIRWTKDEGESQLKAINERLEDLQELLYVEHRHRLLIVLQGMDTSGKDGVIRHVFDGVNPQGVKVASFKVPTQEELDHDYLWRIHRYTPGKGEIVIFNRSHYEDCLVVRVHNLIPRDNWEKRFAQISEFERMLAEEGTTIIKFFLNIDREEQKKRLQARLDDPRKRWKFNPGDVEERKYWDDYMKAYEDVLNKTSTSWAPWVIVPSNHKWFRNMVVATYIVDALESFKMSYPEPSIDHSKVKIE